MQFRFSLRMLRIEEVAKKKAFSTSAHRPCCSGKRVKNCQPGRRFAFRFLRKTTSLWCRGLYPHVASTRFLKLPIIFSIYSLPTQRCYVTRSLSVEKVNEMRKIIGRLPWNLRLTNGDTIKIIKNWKLDTIFDNAKIVAEWKKREKSWAHWRTIN